MSSEPSARQEIYWQEIPHTADWALRVWGADLTALFEHAAWGMLSLIGEPDSVKVATLIQREISLSAPDSETLLVDWLSELLWLIEEEGMVFEFIEAIEVVERNARLQVSGCPGAAYSKHIKAVTYHNLNIRQSEKGYETTLVFDV